MSRVRKSTTRRSTVVSDFPNPVNVEGRREDEVKKSKEVDLEGAGKIHLTVSKTPGVCR
jgi:hypothetical protein